MTISRPKEETSTKRILHVIHSVSLEGGGPAEGLRRLAETDGMQMEVVCLDDPIGLSMCDHPYPITGLGRPEDGHYGYTPQLTAWIVANLERFDGVVIHGLWQYHSYGAYRAIRNKVPYLIFPHGMLDHYFKQAFPLKHLIKSLYWLAFERRVLRDARAVCFTTETERDSSIGTFSPSSWQSVIVPFGTTAPKGNRESQRCLFLEKHSALRTRSFLLFLSRIHRKKGCDILIEAFARIAKDHPNLDLVMAGPDEDGLMDNLIKQARILGVNHRIHWTGMLKDDDKWGAFHAAEAFVLPSHQENFGIAVAEALACSLPALISNKVNIWPDISASGGGIVDDDTTDGMHRALLRFLSLDPSERRIMGERASACFRERYLIDRTADVISELFNISSNLLSTVAKRRVGIHAKKWQTAKGK
jgi:glycosyltransferase involved in cell wall biosynthesis